MAIDLKPIKKMGYQAAQSLFEPWIENHENDAENYPLDEKGNPDKDAFCDFLNDEFWENGLDDIEDDPDLAAILEKYGEDTVGDAYFAGATKFVDEKFISI